MNPAVAGAEVGRCDQTIRLIGFDKKTIGCCPAREMCAEQPIWHLGRMAKVLQER
ncbi:hypothetical protein GCM10011408_17450 [Dyella caseinilytica]|nr:hypothetical protein GCM10011408_17450 [Dyella caseinilytica]